MTQDQEFVLFVVVAFPVLLGLSWLVMSFPLAGPVLVVVAAAILVSVLIALWLGFFS